MQTSLYALVAASLLAAPASTQNFVTNGDFTAGINAWTLGGYSVNAMPETFDTTGLGIDPCFGCNPGGQVTPPPYLPNYIEQTVVLPPVPYEFTADLAVSRVAVVNNADAGTLWVEVNGVEVTRTALGGYTAPLTQRARLAARFTPTVAGPQLLRIYFHRTFLCNNDTPRSHLDNVSLQIAVGPTFALQGNRQLGAARTLDLLGEPNAPLVFFLSSNQIPGIPIPGMNGFWNLDPSRLFVLLSGVPDGSGLLSFPVTLPSDPALLTSPVHVQGLQVGAGLQINLGFPQFLTFVQ